MPGIAFRGSAGVGAPHSTADIAAGELANILTAGYPDVGGIFGARRSHHMREDDARCVLAPLVTPLVDAGAAFLRATLATR